MSLGELGGKLFSLNATAKREDGLGVGGLVGCDRQSNRNNAQQQQHQGTPCYTEKTVFPALATNFLHWLLWVDALQLK